MTTMSISMPETMRKFVDARVKKGSYGTSSEYIRALIRADEERERRLAELRREVQIGVDAAERGDVAEWDKQQFLTKARKQLAERKAHAPR